jgi:hypothetical protein
MNQRVGFTLTATIGIGNHNPTSAFATLIDWERLRREHPGKSDQEIQAWIEALIDEGNAEAEARLSLR